MEIKTNKATVINWYDEDCPDSYILCAAAYGVKFIQRIPIGRFETELVVYGPTENVDHFIEDFYEDSLEPIDEMGRDLEYDEDYVAWLNNEVNYALDLEEAEELIGKGEELDVFAPSAEPTEPTEKPEFVQPEFKF